MTTNKGLREWNLESLTSHSTLSNQIYNNVAQSGAASRKQKNLPVKGSDLWLCVVKSRNLDKY